MSSRQKLRLKDTRTCSLRGEKPCISECCVPIGEFSDRHCVVACLNRASLITLSVLVLCSLLYEFLSLEVALLCSNLHFPFWSLCVKTRCLSMAVLSRVTDRLSDASSQSHLVCVFNNWPSYQPPCLSLFIVGIPLFSVC